MSKKSNLIHQSKQALSKQCKYNQSKHAAKTKARLEAKHTGEEFKQVRGIYSTATYKSYSKVCEQFIRFCLDRHSSEIKNFNDCKDYVNEFLENSQNKGSSAWTLHAYGSALGCAYDCSKNDFGFTFPMRSRENIVRCRDERSSDYRYPDERWEDVKTIIKATGCRRMEVLRLRKEDFRERSDGNLEVYKRGKNGIERWCLVVPKHADFVREYIKTCPTHDINNENRLFLKAELPKGAIHDLRADYAKDLYKYFEDRGDVASGKKYYCRKDMKGQSFDKGILEKVSYNLQHTRANVVVSNYLWKM